MGLRPVHTSDLYHKIFCTVLLCCNQRDNLRISEFEMNCVQLNASCEQVFKPGSHMVVIVVIIVNRKQVQANSERNLSQLL